MYSVATNFILLSFEQAFLVQALWSSMKKKYTFTAVGKQPEPSRPEKFQKTTPETPKVNRLTIQEAEPRRVTTRPPATAPVVVCIYKVTDKAKDVWTTVEQDSASLFQVQMKHDRFTE